MTDKSHHKSRPATAADFRQFFGRLPETTVRARAIEIDGEVVGIGGYYVLGEQAVMFSDHKPGAIPKITIWREVKAFMDTIEMPAICRCTKGSERFLQRLGWVLAEHTDDGDLYRWQR